MNRTNIVIIVIAAVLLAVGSAQTKPAAVPAQPTPTIPCPTTDRYHLFKGEHLVSTDAGATTVKDILRIDTLTGETSQWVNGAKDGKSISFWKRVDPQ